MLSWKFPQHLRPCGCIATRHVCSFMRQILCEAYDLAPEHSLVVEGKLLRLSHQFRNRREGWRCCAPADLHWLSSESPVRNLSTLL